MNLQLQSRILNDRSLISGLKKDGSCLEFQ
jgi:hypothetical protein